MTTTKSFSEKNRFLTVYKTCLKNQFPFLIVSGIVFFLTLLLPLIVLFVQDGVPQPNLLEPRFNVIEYGIYVDEMLMVLTSFIPGIFALVLSLSANHYMHNKRMVDVYHSIPVSRPKLLGANFLASMTTIFLPFLVNYAITILVQLIAMGGKFRFGPAYAWFTLQDILGAILFSVLVYVFMTFISVNVGNTFDTFASGGVLGFAVMFTYLMVGFLTADLTYGFDFSPDSYIVLLSPFTFLFYRYEFVTYNDYQSLFPPGPTLLLYLAAAVLIAVFGFLAVFCYNRRKSELAEQKQSGVFQTLVKVFASICGVILFYAIFRETNMVVILVACVVGAVIIGTIAELIMSRGIRQFRKNLKWLAGTGVLCCLFMLGARYDVTGYVTRVPNPDKVESLYINYDGRFNGLSSYNYNYYKLETNRLTEPESIRIVTDAHRAIVTNPPPTINRYEDYDTHPYERIIVEYKMKNGTTLKRQYSQTYLDAFLMLAQLEDKDDFIRANNPLFYMDTSDFPLEQRIDRITLWDPYLQDSTRLNLSETNAKLLMNALQEDVLAESLEEIHNPSRPEMGYLSVDLRLGPDTKTTNTVQVRLTYEYTRTLAL
ncbi:ABC transporter permease, partial [Ruminococcaceae bacterium OttesenSCG-928-L11]|nr:ABC transporter permease [Ruminococcaceae bacterium OttesenSCG-928-L11]